MNCDEASELLGAYAIDALTGEEATQLRAHLASCADHATQAAGLRAVAGGLAMTVEPVAPPPALRARLLDAVAREPQLPPVQASSPRSIVRARAERDGAVRRREVTRDRAQWAPAAFRSIPPVWGSIAAVLVVAVGGLLAWNVVLMNRDEGGADRFASRATAIVELQSEGAQGNATLVYFGADKRAALVANGLQVLGDSQTYQMWVIRDGEPQSLGTMDPDDTGRMTGSVRFEAEPGDVVAVTVEPAGGSAAPTTEPIFTAGL